MAIASVGGCTSPPSAPRARGGPRTNSNKKLEQRTAQSDNGWGTGVARVRSVSGSQNSYIAKRPVVKCPVVKRPCGTTRSPIIPGTPFAADRQRAPAIHLQCFCGCTLCHMAPQALRQAHCTQPRATGTEGPSHLRTHTSLHRLGPGTKSQNSRHVTRVLLNAVACECN
jgi:hypothetical protein